MFNKSPILKKYLVGALLGLLVGVLIHYVAPRKFTGDAYIQIGMTSTNQYIEPIALAIERLRSVYFLSVVAKKINRPEALNLLNEKGAGYSIKLLKGSEIIIVSVTADSAELVRTILDSVVEEIASVHADILYKKNSPIRDVLLKNEAKLEGLNKRVKAFIADSAGKQNDLIVWLQLNELQHKRDVIVGMSFDLMFNKSKEYNTSLLAYQIAPSEKNILYSLWRASLFGALLGVFVILLSSMFTRRN